MCVKSFPRSPEALSHFKACGDDRLLALTKICSFHLKSEDDIETLLNLALNTFDCLVTQTHTDTYTNAHTPPPTSSSTGAGARALFLFSPINLTAWVCF